MPDPPKDPTITTLFIGNITSPDITQQTLDDKFASYGPIEAIKLIHSKQVAFIAFKERSSAEQAFSSLYERLYLGS